MSSINVNDNNFVEEVVNSQTTVMVDFWAEWCAPCKNLSPLIDDVAHEMSDKIKIVKINIDESPDTPTKYGIKGLPTLMIFKNGQVVDTKIGGMSKGQLVEWLENNI